MQAKKVRVRDGGMLARFSPLLVVCVGMICVGAEVGHAAPSSSGGEGGEKSGAKASGGSKKSSEGADNKTGKEGKGGGEVKEAEESKAKGGKDAKAGGVKLPGLEIHAEERYVDVQSKICLEKGALEVIACTKDSREHESIVVVDAKPMHIHAALLLLGGQNGNPAMRRPIEPDSPRWEEILPKGDVVEVFLVIKNAEGKNVERPIKDFLMPSEDEFAEIQGKPKRGKVKDEFPKSFVFSGSFMMKTEDGQQQYLADSSGNVISISTFGDEVICLPGIHGQDNGSLEWQINPKHMPKVGTPVLLRLKLGKKK